MKIKIIYQFNKSYTYTILPTIICWKHDLTGFKMGKHTFVGFQWWNNVIGLDFETKNEK